LSFATNPEPLGKPIRDILAEVYPSKRIGDLRPRKLDVHQSAEQGEHVVEPACENALFSDYAVNPLSKLGFGTDYPHTDDP
jgi:hypothetical protein